MSYSRPFPCAPILLVLSLVLPVALPAQAPVRAPDPVDARLAERIGAIAMRDFVEHSFAGMSLLVARGPRILFSQAFGHADLETKVPVTLGTVFGLQSVSKQFQAAAILRLAEEGKLSLDDEISRWYPLPSSPGTKRPTIRQLLGHTAGIPVRIAPERRPTDARSPRQMRQVLAAEPLDFAPGSGWRYSTSGFSLAAGIVEEASGQPFYEYLRDRFLVPLGMHSTHLCSAGSRIAALATPYVVSRETRTHSPVPLEQNGPLCSSVEDLLRWQRGLAGGSVLTSASYHRMTTSTTLDDGTILHYGLGVATGVFEGHRKTFHVGGGGGYSTILAHYPDDDLTVVILTNTNQRGQLRETERKIARAVLGLPEPKNLPVGPGEAARYTGSFSAGPLELRVREEGGVLYLEAERLDPFAFIIPVRLLKQAKDEFVVDYDAGTRLRFVLSGEQASAVEVRQGGRTFRAERTR